MKPARRLRRFHSAQPLVSVGQIVSLTVSETHHLRDIIRLGAGDYCLLTDGAGSEATAKIIDFLEENICRLVIEELHPMPVSGEGLKIRVGLAITKKDKMDYLIEKAQELGVSELWPIEAERSVVHIPKEKQSGTLARWQKKVIGASKQSGNLTLLKIMPPKPFQEVVKSIPGTEDRVIFHPDPDAQPFKEWVEELREKREKGTKPDFVLNLFFGPEGGFSGREMGWLKTQKEKQPTSCRIVSLGENILKMDTAFLGVISSLRFLSL